MEQLKNESSRQYEYMEEMKKWVQKKSEELGRKLTCHVTTFGCQMNEKDSEKLLGILETIGYEEVETEEADFLIFNTCTVRENANFRKSSGRSGIVHIDFHSLLLLAIYLFSNYSAPYSPNRLFRAFLLL